MGTTRTFSAIPAWTRTVAPIPAKTVTPTGTEHRAVVPPPLPAAGPGPSPPPVAWSSPAGGGPPRTRPPQVNGAGPPCTSTSATAGGASSRNWSAWVSVAVTERVPGETAPTLSPTATIWSTSTSTVVSFPAAGAVTVEVRTSGVWGVMVGFPSGSVPATGGRSCSLRISRMACPALTVDPAATSTRRTVPAAVALTVTSGSATTVPCTVTVFSTVPRPTGTVGEVSWSVGASGPAASVVIPAPPPNASATSATAMTVHTSRRSTGRTMVRTTDMHAPCALGYPSVPVLVAP